MPAPLLSASQAKFFPRAGQVQLVLGDEGLGLGDGDAQAVGDLRRVDVEQSAPLDRDPDALLALGRGQRRSRLQGQPAPVQALQLIIRPLAVKRR